MVIFAGRYRYLHIVSHDSEPLMVVIFAKAKGGKDAWELLSERYELFVE